jgi:hypothetical protein
LCGFFAALNSDLGKFQSPFPVFDNNLRVLFNF